MKVVLEKRLEQSLKAQIGLPVLSALMALVFCGVFFAITGKDPLLVYETMVIGSNPAAARYAGMDIARNVLIAMFISGAVCGLAGMVEVSGIVGKLQHGISPGYGYTAIIIAWLARLNPPAIILVSFLFAVIHVGGFMLQTMGISAAAATMLQGAVLFFVVGTEIFTGYKLRIVKGGAENE